MKAIDEILEFWFGDKDPNDPETLNFGLWFQGPEEVDREIKTRFQPLIEQAGLGALEDWKETPRGRMAWTLLLDQFTRNAYRGTVRMYAFDLLVLHSTREAVRIGQDKEMPPIYRAFLYLPMQHAEEVQAQDESVVLYEALAKEARNHPQEGAITGMLDYAERHARVVHRFGRFPHRNEILMRESTEEEKAFLASDEAPF